MGLIANQLAFDLLLKLKQKIKDKRIEKRLLGSTSTLKNPKHRHFADRM